MKVTLKNVRLSFPELFEPKKFSGDDAGKAAYSAAFLIDPKSPQVAEIKKIIADVAKEKWGAKTDANMKAIAAKDRICLHDGDAKANYEGYEGMLYISARNTARPTVVDRDKTPLTERDGKPYSGCYVNAVIDIYAQDNAFGKGINASLMGVQFAADGDAFAGGGVANADDFDDLGDGSDAGDIA